MLASEFVAKHNVTVSWKYRETLTVDGWEHKRWTVYLTNSYGQTVSFSYRTGMALDRPEVAGVLYALASDCRLYEEHANQMEVADTFGIGADAARKLYDGCNATSDKLYEWAVSPDMFTDLLSVDEG